MECQKRAVGYIRISTSEQSNFSLSGQQSIIEKYCLQHNLELIEVYQDDGVSGKNFNRPAWKTLISKLKKGGIDCLVVVKYDRLGRNAGEALQQITAIEEQYFVKIVSAMEQFHIDVQSPFFFKMRADMLVNADFERRVIRDRTKFGIWHGRSEGRHLSTAPFGYKNERDEKNKPIITIDEPRASIIRQMFSEFINGLNMTQIRSNALLRGFTLKSKSAIQRILSNPTYAGYVIVPPFQKEPSRLVKSLHAPLISEIEYLKSQELLFGNTQTHKKERDELPLRGYLICPTCQKLMTGAKSKGKKGVYYWYYRCAKCKGAKSYNAQKVEQILLEILLQISLDAEFVDMIIDSALRIETISKGANESLLLGLKKQIAETQEKINKLEDKYINDEIEQTTYKRWKPTYLRTLHDLQNKINELGQSKIEIIEVIENNKHLLFSIGNLYENANSHSRLMLLKLVFQSSLTLLDYTFETPFCNPIFEDKILTISNIRIKKDGNNTVLNTQKEISTRDGT